ncbi:MAG: hypothetical protein ACRERD_22200 [Candidatus Binatia bacterium]
MKNLTGLIVPVAMVLVGVYALFMTLGIGGEQVVLLSDHAVPYGLALMIGLLGLGGGALLMVMVLSSRKPAS